MLARWSSGLPLSNATTTFFSVAMQQKKSLRGRSAMWNWKIYISWRLKIYKLCMTGFYYALSTCCTRNILEMRIERNKLIGTVFVKIIFRIFKKHRYYQQPYLLIFYYSENVRWGKSDQNVLPQQWFFPIYTHVKYPLNCMITNRNPTQQLCSQSKFTALKHLQQDFILSRKNMGSCSWLVKGYLFLNH